ncbi:LacI family DNA-binding transcriptional regulator [Lachnotalea sp. AF33-28]|uniref:LacI family DNA-binding transcriptional regulator n=1 Tax=Lachnotalea sp. AF33-28 TaxID=2292046 RepID=UPI000E4DE369|nr:LacI family DNA-binding transcriptional regulator [Lachnotalea sp. AF33-28]RHP32025.1 LacI family transcriptional regulator [Lachnotalea sp. AF33-28]
MENKESRITKKITIADIADMAGVTKSTVSRYFNGGSVKGSTREKIQEIVKAHDYEPNTFARLKASKSNVIGVVLPTLNSKVTSRVITSIGRYLREHGYEALIKDSDHSSELERRNIQWLIAQNVDGILLSAITMSEEHRQLIHECPVPVVVLAQDYGDGITVTQDDYGAGRAMGMYIGRSGPGRVAYLGVNESDAAVGIERRRGVIDGLKECGITDILTVTGDYSYQSGQEMAEAVLKEGPVDAMICATDRLAFGAYRVLERHGLNIPDDVSVAGFGGYDESELLKPQLTTLRFDSYTLGYLGAETLLKRIRKEPVPKKQIVDYTLIEGQSVKIPSR